MPRLSSGAAAVRISRETNKIENVFSKMNEKYQKTVDFFHWKRYPLVNDKSEERDPKQRPLLQRAVGW